MKILQYLIKALTTEQSIFRIFLHFVRSLKNAKISNEQRMPQVFFCAINYIREFFSRIFLHHFRIVFTFLRKNAIFREKVCENRTKILAFFRKSF